jgi:hypothetical protein
VEEMRTVAQFSVKDGKHHIEKHYPAELEEVLRIIETTDAEHCKTKISKEKTMPGMRLYSPVCMNKAFEKGFYPNGWKPEKVACEYSTEEYVKGYTPPKLNEGAYREMDFVKGTLGVEVQFGKYAFMVYNVCAKMTIFRNEGKILAGIEIVPVKRLQMQMSSGVSYFEQFVWDLKRRGVADIDIPVLILGVDTHIENVSKLDDF